MDKREQIKKWFSLLDSEHKNNAEIILSQKFGVTTNTVRMMWVYAGKATDEVLDFVLKTLKNQCTIQDVKRQKEIKELTDVL